MTYCQKRRLHSAVRCDGVMPMSFSSACVRRDKARRCFEFACIVVIELIIVAALNVGNAVFSVMIAV